MLLERAEDVRLGAAFHITMPHIKSKNQGRGEGMKKEECRTEKGGVCVANSRKRIDDRSNLMNV